MNRKKLVYISDQKFYLGQDKSWYTTSSFPQEIIDIFDHLEEWVFFGRLYDNENVDNLYKLNFNGKVKINFRGQSTYI